MVMTMTLTMKRMMMMMMMIIMIDGKKNDGYGCYRDDDEVFKQSLRVNTGIICYLMLLFFFFTPFNMFV